MSNLLFNVNTIITIAVIAVIALIIIIIICWAIGTRNGFIRKKNNNEEAFSTIDIYLKKRFDLIPNLVETVKGYAKHESETLENVINARKTGIAATTTAEKVAADAAMTRAIVDVKKVAERYPDLKANTNFLDLSNQLKNIETELASARKYYNGVVKSYNTDKDIFPKSIIAKAMKLEKAPYFELENAEERNNVQVKF